MPILSEYLGGFSPTRPRNSSEWAIPTFAGIAATMFWSRVAGRYEVKTDDGSQSKVQYTVPDDQIQSTRGTMSPSGLLYAILLLHPIIEFTALLVLTLYSDTPISEGFNIVAILSGIDPTTLPILKGAGFSGTLKKKVRMQVVVNS